MKIENKFEALCLALELAITAPTGEKARQCVEIAEDFSRGFSAAEVERAKTLVEQRLFA